MNNYDLMKLSELCDDDAYDYIDFEYEELESQEDTPENFKRKYKEFYTDIKLSHKEDW